MFPNFSLTQLVTFTFDIKRDKETETWRLETFKKKKNVLKRDKEKSPGQFFLTISNHSYNFESFWQFHIILQNIESVYICLRLGQFGKHFSIWTVFENVAKGTTDPGYSVCIYNLSYLSSKIEFHLHCFQIWPIVCGSTCISSKFDHQVKPPELVPNLANILCN